MIRYLLLILILTTYGANAQNRTESLKIIWPEEYKWKVGSDQENSQQHMLELVPGSETVDKWSIIGTMLSIKNVKNVPMDVAMNLMFKQAKQSAIDPVLTLIARNDSATHPWIIFKIETAAFKDEKKPESQLYYIVQGESSLYSNFVAIKEKSLSQTFCDRWTSVFKSSELVYD